MTEPMLSAITPVILTYNEAPNIGRTLAGLHWAKEIVVVDSESTDGTIEMLQADPRVRLHVRKFSSHNDQWQFATSQTGIETPWILRLDADYQIPPALVEEMARLDPNGPEQAYRVRFDYAIYSKVLANALYPPKTVLLRCGSFAVLDAGHTEAWKVEGRIGELKARIIHDDWKPMPSWIASQTNYMRRELAHKSHSGLIHWLRSHPPLMMVAVFFYCLFAKGLIFNGRKGIMYTLQRTVAEGIYGLLYLEERSNISVATHIDSTKKPRPESP
jgi:glycosyltransferase involved in cell wall biosynthesis